MRIAEDTIKKQLAIIEKTSFCEVKGSLKTIKKGKKYHFSLQHYDSDRGKYVCKYIKDENINFAEQIALRDYYQTLYEVLNDQLAKLKFLSAINIEEIINNCYLSMNEGKRSLIPPIEGSIQSRIDAWYDEKYKINQSYPETLIHPTDRGEYVRSKSEELIANYLYSMKEFIDYRYERPLEVVIAGKKEIIHPDFTIINLRTGKIFVLEHVSRLDQPEYHDAFVWKHRAYIENGMYQDGRIIYSFESAGKPLDMKQIKKLIWNIILEED